MHQFQMAVSGITKFGIHIVGDGMGGVSMGIVVPMGATLGQ